LLPCAVSENHHLKHSVCTEIKFFQILLLLVSQCGVEAAKIPVPKCGDNETFDECGMKKCDPKCKIEGSEEEDEEETDADCRSRVCARPGACVCKKGYYRNKKEECVDETDCQEDFMEFITFSPS
ncbi:trypsin Inhibitor like cysteine rich domain protein, partial [Ancylostoma caninum]